MRLDMPALALTDRDGLYGAVRFRVAARERGIQPIYGAEVTLEDGWHLVLLAETQGGYHNLSRLISRAQLAGEKGRPWLKRRWLDELGGGLIALTGSRRGRVPGLILRGQYKEARRALTEKAEGGIGGWQALRYSQNPTAGRARLVESYKTVVRRRRRGRRELPQVRALKRQLRKKLGKGGETTVDGRTHAEAFLKSIP